MRLILMALIATLLSVSSAESGTVILKNTETENFYLLEGYDSGWAEIDPDEYMVLPYAGQIVKRAGEWDSYTAFRGSGVLIAPDGTANQVTHEPLVFVETTQSAVIGEGNALNAESAYQQLVQNVVGGEQLRINENGLRSGVVEINGALRLGNGVQVKRARTLSNDDSFGDDAWTNVTAARREDGESASVAVVNPGVPATDSNYLRATNFNFRIPRGATITNVTLYVKGYASTGSGHVVYPQLVYNGTPIGTVGLGGFDTTSDWQTFAGDDATWAASLSSGMVNDANFGIVFYAENQAMASTITFYVDAIKLQITYRTATNETVAYLDGNHCDSIGVLNLDAMSATPTDPTESSDANVYVKDGKLVVQYNDAGTVRYKYLDLTGTGATWADDTTAP